MTKIGYFANNFPPITEKYSLFNVCCDEGYESIKTRPGQYGAVTYCDNENLRLIPPLVVELRYWFETKGSLMILSKKMRRLRFWFSM